MSDRKTRRSKIVTYAAISAALGSIMLTIGAYTGLGEFFWYFAASVCVMITFANKSLMGSILAFVVCSFVALLTTGFNIVFLLPYFVFFGAYPVSMYIEENFGVNKWLMIILTCLWFDAAMYAFYLFTKLFITDIAFINDYIVIIILTLGSIVFLLYRFVMKRIWQKLQTILKKLRA